MIYNQWYVILESTDLKQHKTLKVRRMNENLVLWRDQSNNISCIEDRCCHRGASLGCGRIVGGLLECPFHGFLYDGSGKVNVIPANGKNSQVPATMVVKSFRTFEAYGLIWLWWGDDDECRLEPFSSRN